MILDFLYNLFVGPIEFLVEVVFAFMMKLTHSEILSIVGVSLVVNFLVLPLYKKSDAVQEKEREKQKEMEPWLKHIRKAFKGDKRYMIQTTYYRQQNYKPIYALRGSLSLLLQIPFFIAAYNFLSRDGLLTDVSFWIFKSLGEPDELLHIGSFAINVLPILMTLVNFVSGAIYTKGFPLKDKIQLYGTAIVFLVLLYTSPSGLVFYWLLNNVFSLFKNIIMAAVKKIKKNRGNKEKKKFKLFQTKPFMLLSSFFYGKNGDEAVNKAFFFISGFFLVVLMGILIPVNVIKASAVEFVYDYYGPVNIIIYTFSMFLGFMLWFSIFYFLMETKAKNIFTYLMCVVAAVSGVNYFFFGKDFGMISPYLVYDDPPITTRTQKLVNLAIVMAVALAVCLVVKYIKTISKYALTVLLIASIVFSVIGGVSISNDIKQLDTIRVKDFNGEGIITLSRTGKNVVFIMPDRAISGYLPMILEEKPELRERLQGFTYYPNAVSCGQYTNMCTPALFGGYEYTMDKINQMTDKTLLEKQNESLSVMPVLFSNNGFDVTVMDPPYVGNYDIVPDVSIYDQYEGIDAYVTDGNYRNDSFDMFEDIYEGKQLRNFVGHSFFKCAPLLFQFRMYDYGHYYSIGRGGISSPFLNAYMVLDDLDYMTNITDEGENTFLMLQNATSHEPVFLSAPDYLPDTNCGDDEENNLAECHYDVNMVTIMLLCDWFDYLRENGVYDNTRIIICADHGRELGEFDNLRFPIIDAELCNPLMMVKDFNDNDEFRTDNTFMTIADVPTLAVDGVIENPVNPFTGNLISSQPKEDGPFLVTTSHHWDTTEDYGGPDGTFLDVSDGYWVTVQDNIFVMENWQPYNPG